MSASEVNAILDDAASAYREWSAAGLAARLKCLERAARILRERSSEWAELMAREMGKPVRQGRAEADKCALACDYYVAKAASLLADEEADAGGARAFVRYQPLGVILAVMPWNFPFWQLFRAAAPALAAGNAMLLKHSSNVSGCAIAIESILHEAGVPRRVFRALLIESSRVEALIAHPNIAGVTLTGSEGAGRSVGAAAGKALKPSVLELGGSDPFIVLEDADPKTVARQAAAARTINSGQSCIAAKRFFAVDAIYDAFSAAFHYEMRTLRLGDPLDEATDIGPQARTELRDELHTQVERSVAAGARLTLGGTKPERTGAWYPATILEDVQPGMPAFDEELFGPAAALTRVSDANEAVRLANTSRFGLGASIWTANVHAAQSIIDALECGMVFVNEIVKSDPRLPFGGIKNSGYGRELAAVGIRSFVNAKTVWTK
jgi:succinate-semialdehyde dehydrogenase/glutarate-semialdehyde dehydrogenase